MLRLKEGIMKNLRPTRNTLVVSRKLLGSDFQQNSVKEY